MLILKTYCQSINLCNDYIEVF